MTTALAQGDLRPLDTGVARRRLAALAPLRLAYVARDGAPRVVPVLFPWTGEEVVMGGFAVVDFRTRFPAAMPEWSRS